MRRARQIQLPLRIGPKKTALVGMRLSRPAIRSTTVGQAPILPIGRGKI